MERGELNQSIEPGAPFHRAGRKAKKEARLRTELHGIRRDREIAVGMDTRKRFVDQIKGDALWRWERQWWRSELWVKAAHGEDEIRVVTIGEQHLHLTGDGNEQDVRVEKRSEEIKALFVEFKQSREIDLQNQNRDFLGRQGHLQDAENGSITRWNLDDHAQREADQGRRAPSDFGHGADQKDPFLRREDGAQVADDSWSIRHDILRKHDALDCAGANVIHQRLEPHGAVPAEQAAYGQQREAEAELDAGAKISSNNDE